jgi:hypothetical protein
MKSIKNISTGIIALVIVLLTGATSCSDMNELSDKWLVDKGVTVYASKVDYVFVYSGYNRIELAVLINSQRIDTLQIFRSNGEIVSKLKIGNQPGIYRLWIDDMKENEENLFYLVSADSWGNQSLPYEVIGMAYGPTYAQQALIRRIASLDMDGTDGVITWGGKTKDLVYTEVRYTTNANEKEIVRILPDENTVICPDAKVNEPFETCSAFLPPAGVDTIRTEWITDESEVFREMELCSKTGWVVLSASDELSGYPKTAVIDNNYDTHNNFWHSLTSAASPHNLVIDMKNPIEISKIVTWRRDIGDTKTIEYYVGNNPNASATTWTKIASGAVWNDDNVCTLKPSNIVSGRYLKLVMPDSNRESIVSITEIDVYQFKL